MECCTFCYHLQMSYGAVTPILSDRERCPTFYRIVQSAAQQNVPRLRILQMFGWNRVAIIRHSNVLFTAVSQR